MPARYTLRRFLTVASACLLAVATAPGAATLSNTRTDSSAAGTSALPSGAFSVNVTGVSPGSRETANLCRWSGRTPAAAASGAIGSLAQTWVDNSQSGSSGQIFGAMAAITAGGQNVTASVVSSTEVQVSFNPNSDGSFRVIIVSPRWPGGNATATASNLIGGDTTATTSSLLSEFG